MASGYKVYIYADDRGREPYTKWLRGLAKSNPRAAAAVAWLVSRLGDKGPELGAPYVTVLDGPVRELRRLSGNDPVRVYFFQYTEDAYVVVCGEVKKKNSPDPKLVELTRRAREEMLDRLKRGM